MSKPRDSYTTELIKDLRSMAEMFQDVAGEKRATLSMSSRSWEELAEKLKEAARRLQK